MLAWDRIVGNLLEQAMPFLTVFWLNIGLAALGATDYTGVAIAGWIYVVFRALYPVSFPLPCLDNGSSTAVGNRVCSEKPTSTYQEHMEFLI